MKKALLVGLLTFTLLMASLVVMDMSAEAIERDDLSVYLDSNLLFLNDMRIDIAPRDLDLSRGGGYDFDYISTFALGVEASDVIAGLDLSGEYSAIVSPSQSANDRNNSDLSLLWVHGIGANASYELPLPVESLSVAVKGGLAYHFGSVDFEYEGDEDSLDLEGSVGFNIGVQPKLALSDDLSLRANAGYQLLEMDFEDIDKAVDFSGLVVGAGVQYNF